MNKVASRVFNIAYWAVFVQVNMWNDSKSFIVSELKEFWWKKIQIVRFCAKIFLTFPNIRFPKFCLLSNFPCNATTLATPVGRILRMTCFTLLSHSDFLLAILIKRQHSSQIQTRITSRYRVSPHSVSELKRVWTIATVCEAAQNSLLVLLYVDRHANLALTIFFFFIVWSSTLKLTACNWLPGRALHIGQWFPNVFEPLPKSTAFTCCSPCSLILVLFQVNFFGSGR